MVKGLDIQAIANAGILSTPAVTVDGEDPYGTRSQSLDRSLKETAEGRAPQREEPR